MNRYIGKNSKWKEEISFYVHLFTTQVAKTLLMHFFVYFIFIYAAVSKII